MRVKRRGRRRRRVTRGRGLPAVDQGKIYFGRGRKRRQTGKGSLSKFLAGAISALGQVVGL